MHRQHTWLKVELVVLRRWTLVQCINRVVILLSQRSDDCLLVLTALKSRRRVSVLDFTKLVSSAIFIHDFFLQMLQQSRYRTTNKAISMPRHTQNTRLFNIHPSAKYKQNPHRLSRYLHIHSQTPAISPTFVPL